MLLLGAAQVVGLVYLPWNIMVELVLKVFISSFAVLVMLNELEWWGMLRDSQLLWNWLSRRYFYVVSCRIFHLNVTFSYVVCIFV